MTKCSSGHTNTSQHLSSSKRQFGKVLLNIQILFAGTALACWNRPQQYVWVTRFKQIELARWLEELSQYNMTIVHRDGCKHVNADALSHIGDALMSCDCYIGDALMSCDCYTAGADLRERRRIFKNATLQVRTWGIFPVMAAHTVLVYIISGHVSKMKWTILFPGCPQY